MQNGTARQREGMELVFLFILLLVVVVLPNHAMGSKPPFERTTTTTTPSGWSGGGGATTPPPPPPSQQKTSSTVVNENDYHNHHDGDDNYNSMARDDTPERANSNIWLDPITTPSSIQEPSTAAAAEVTTTSTKHPTEEILYVVKRNGLREVLNRTKVWNRLHSLLSVPRTGKDDDDSDDDDVLDTRFVNLESLTDSIVLGVYPNVTTDEIDILAAETAASMSTQHVDYARLAARIRLTANHKNTPPTFSQAMQLLSSSSSQEENGDLSSSSSSQEENGDSSHEADRSQQQQHQRRGFLDPRLAQLIQRHANRINARIVTERDFGLTYFGFNTLERSYLLRSDDGQVIERPQYLMMRVALGIHCANVSSSSSPTTFLHDEAGQQEAHESQALEAAFETYDLLSQGFMIHASPALFHAGTIHAQLSSCFLLQISEDSISGIYDTLKRCAEISKAAGGIGLSVHTIRARGTPIQGTRGVSNGLVPMLRVYDVTSRYVDQGGGKRPGAFAIYLEPWHSDIFDVLNLKKNHGKEEQRARDLFYGLWIPDLFMKRVQDDGVWSLMCPHLCPGLSQCYGKEFEELYERYEQEGRFSRRIRARDLWNAIVEAQIECGNPYMMYKDACNTKSNQQNLGTIKCSNLCSEIIQFTDPEEVAVCNLASLCLPKFVVSDRGPFGSVSPDSGRAYFDHGALHAATKIVTRNLNKIIDLNKYPVEGSRQSNLRHRPIGIGVSGLADAFLRLGLAFTSDQAKELNSAIFETIYHAALEASAELAEADGPYATFAGSPASKGQLQFNLWGMDDHETPSRQYFAVNHDHPSVQSKSLQRYPLECEDCGGYDWDDLRRRIMTKGLRNSLLVAPMPTASTSQILGVNECFEPFSSNLYIRRVKAGEFIMANPHLLQDLTDRGLWTPSVRNQLMRDGGSVRNIAEIPEQLKELYKTVWEIKMKDVIDMSADRGRFVDQSQSLNLFIADPTLEKLTAMHFYAWKKGLKTGMYYLRTKPAANAIQYTVEKTAATSYTSTTTEASSSSFALPSADMSDDVCIHCQV
ncbi:hypothetical protein ACA910_005618 [Epithemia clementina (nom. ined.)]